MNIEIYNKNGLNFMKSNPQTAEQLVDELNLLRELKLPLFF